MRKWTLLLITTAAFTNGLPRIFIGRLIGPFLKSIYTNEKPFAKNGPAGKELVVADQRDCAREQERLKMKIRQFYDAEKPNARATHIRSSAPELVLIEGMQQVAIKRDESLSPSLLTFRSHFAAIHHH